MTAADLDSPLVRALIEIERHAASAGWDQPPRLFALASTTELLDREPALAEQLGLSPDAGPITPIEQEQVPIDRPLDDTLAEIAWPPTVIGCALAIERLVLPPSAEATMPEDDAEAITYAHSHPDRAEIRLVVGVLRDGTRQAVMRVRGHEEPGELVVQPDLSPQLSDALAATLLP